MERSGARLSIFRYLCETADKRNAVFCVLIDPDKADPARLYGFIGKCGELGVDALLVGASLIINDSFNQTVNAIKSRSPVPVILFPGSSTQVSPHADAILFLSLISGRNPNYLFGDQVIAAPSIKKSGIEPISTGYMLIEAGSVSSTEYISNTRPIPRDKPEIALAHALAAEYLGMKLIYLEAGSGARLTVPNEMISLVKKETTIPLIVGGGITDPDTASEKVSAGADIVVVGNALENEWHDGRVKSFAEAIHKNR
ncbi:geranylgeranylglyceryl/heptaprenylglyceryl phosphate synthase [candidate division KSB1 bacterium]